MYKIQFLKLLLVLVISSMYNCSSSYPDDVQLVLNNAEENKSELIAAIDYFKKQGDEQKLEAVYYLIAGMNNKYSYTGTAFDLLYKKIKSPILELDSLSHLPRFTAKKLNNISKRKRKRVVRDLMKQKVYELEKIADCKIITSDYMIKNVEQAFKSWSMPWSKNVSFDQFCEYILPYKIGNESITDWREEVLDDFSWVKGSMANSTLKEVCMALNDSIRYKVRQDIKQDYPIQLDYNSMKFIRRGSCEHVTNFTIFVMRGLGIPVSKEISAFLNETSHKWGALHLHDGRIVPFEAATNKYGFDLIYEGATKTKYNASLYETTVYRKIVKVERFVYNSKSIKKGSNHNIYKDKCDVTSEYVTVSDIELDVKHSYFKNEMYALSSFNRQSWKPVFFSNSRTNKLKFENLARGVVYLPKILTEKGLNSNGNPFLIDAIGNVQEIKSDKVNKQDITLIRKYPLRNRVKYWSDKLVGSRFQVANSIDFIDSITVSTITKAPLNYYQEQMVSLESKYQFFRILFPYHSEGSVRATIAEIEVFATSNKDPFYGEFIGANVVGGIDKLSNVFDNKPLSFAEAKENAIAWMGMDFGKPISIKKIRYLQRSDLNMIVPGNRYELVYWDDQWVSLGIKTATGNELKYANVPKNALFLLHNLTEGKEERIFLYEDGKQVFY